MFSKDPYTTFVLKIVASVSHDTFLTTYAAGCMTSSTGISESEISQKWKSRWLQTFYLYNKTTPIFVCFLAKMAEVGKDNDDRIKLIAFTNETLFLT